MEITLEVKIVTEKYDDAQACADEVAYDLQGYGKVQVDVKRPAELCHPKEAA